MLLVAVVLNGEMLCRLSFIMQAITMYFSGSHSATNILEAFEACTTEFNISVDYAVTDNASSMKKAFSFDIESVDTQAVDEEEIDEPVDFRIQNVSRLSCFAHTLQLVVNDGLKENKVC